MVFTKVSPKTLEALKTRLSQVNQASLSTALADTNSGHIMGHGVNLNYTYAPDAQTLTVDVIHHPFYIPVDLIERQIADAIEKATPLAEKAA